MPVGVIFWVLWLLGLLLSGWGWRTASGEPWVWGGGLLLWALLFLLGWHSFGALVR